MNNAEKTHTQNTGRKIENDNYRVMIKFRSR